MTEDVIGRQQAESLKRRKKKKRAAVYGQQRAGIQQQADKLRQPTVKPVPSVTKQEDIDPPDPISYNIDGLTKAYMNKYGKRPTAQQAFELVTMANQAFTAKEWGTFLAPGLSDDPFTAKLMRLTRAYYGQTGMIPDPAKVRAALQSPDPDGTIATIAAEQNTYGDRDVMGMVVQKATKQDNALLGSGRTKWSKKDLEKLGIVIGEAPKTKKAADYYRMLANRPMHTLDKTWDGEGDTQIFSEADRELINAAREWYNGTSLKHRINQNIAERAVNLVNEDGTKNLHALKMFSINSGQNNGNPKEPDTFAWYQKQFALKKRSELSKKEELELDQLGAFLSSIYPDLRLGKNFIWDVKFNNYAARYLLESSLYVVLNKNKKKDGTPVVSADMRAAAMINITVATGGDISATEDIHKWMSEMRILGDQDEMYSDKLATSLFGMFQRTRGRGHPFMQQVAMFANFMGEESLPQDLKKVWETMKGEYAPVYQAMIQEESNNPVGPLAYIFKDVLDSINQDSLLENQFDISQQDIAEYFWNEENRPEWLQAPGHEKRDVGHTWGRTQGKLTQVQSGDPFDPLNAWVQNKAIPLVTELTIGTLDAVEKMKNRLYLTMYLLSDLGKDNHLHFNMPLMAAEKAGLEGKPMVALSTIDLPSVPLSAHAYSWSAITDAWGKAGEQVNWGKGDDPMGTLDLFKKEQRDYSFGNQAWGRARMEDYGLNPDEHGPLLFATDLVWSFAVDVGLDMGVGVLAKIAKQTVAGLAEKMLSKSLQAEIKLARTALTTSRATYLVEREAFRVEYKRILAAAAELEAAGKPWEAKLMRDQAKRLTGGAKEKFLTGKAARQEARKTLSLLQRPMWYDQFAFGFSRSNLPGEVVAKILNVSDKTFDAMGPQRAARAKQLIDIIGFSTSEDTILKSMNELRMLGVKLDPGRLWLGKGTAYRKWADSITGGYFLDKLPQEIRIAWGARNADRYIDIAGRQYNMGLEEGEITLKNGQKVNGRKYASERVNYYLKRLYELHDDRTIVEGRAPHSIDYKRQQIWREFCDEVVQNLRDRGVSEDMYHLLEKYGRRNNFHVESLRSDVTNMWEAFQAFRRLKEHKSVGRLLKFKRDPDGAIYAVDFETGEELTDPQLFGSIEEGTRNIQKGDLAKDLVAPFDLQDMSNFLRGKAGNELWLYSPHIFPSMGFAPMSLINAMKTLAITNAAFAFSAFMIDEFWRFPVEWARGNLSFNPIRFHQMRKYLKETGMLREIGDDPIKDIMGRSKHMVHIDPSDPNYYKWLNAFNKKYKFDHFFKDFEAWLKEFPQQEFETDAAYRERFKQHLIEKIMAPGPEGDELRLRMAATYRGFNQPYKTSDKAARELNEWQARLVELDDELQGQWEELHGDGGLLQQMEELNNQELTTAFKQRKPQTHPYTPADLDVFPEFTGGRAASKIPQPVRDAHYAFVSKPNQQTFDALKKAIVDDLDSRITAAEKRLEKSKELRKKFEREHPKRGKIRGRRRTKPTTITEMVEQADNLDELAEVQKTIDEALTDLRTELDKVKTETPPPPKPVKRYERAPAPRDYTPAAPQPEAAPAPKPRRGRRKTKKVERLKKLMFLDAVPLEFTDDAAKAIRILIDDFNKSPSAEKFLTLRKQLGMWQKDAAKRAEKLAVTLEAQGGDIRDIRKWHETAEKLSDSAGTMETMKYDGLTTIDEIDADALDWRPGKAGEETLHMEEDGGTWDFVVAQEETTKYGTQWTVYEVGRRGDRRLIPGTGLYKTKEEAKEAFRRRVMQEEAEQVWEPQLKWNKLKSGSETTYIEWEGKKTYIRIEQNDSGKWSVVRKNATDSKYTENFFFGTGEKQLYSFKTKEEAREAFERFYLRQPKPEAAAVPTAPIRGRGGWSTTFPGTKEKPQDIGAPLLYDPESKDYLTVNWDTVPDEEMDKLEQNQLWGHHFFAEKRAMDANPDAWKAKKNVVFIRADSLRTIYIDGLSGTPPDLATIKKIVADLYESGHARFDTVINYAERKAGQTVTHKVNVADIIGNTRGKQIKAYDSFEYFSPPAATPEPPPVLIKWGRSKDGVTLSKDGRFAIVWQQDGGQTWYNIARLQYTGDVDGAIYHGNVETTLSDAKKFVGDHEEEIDNLFDQSAPDVLEVPTTEETKVAAATGTEQLEERISMLEGKLEQVNELIDAKRQPVPTTREIPGTTLPRKEATPPRGMLTPEKEKEIEKNLRQVRAARKRAAAVSMPQRRVTVFKPEPSKRNVGQLLHPGKQSKSWTANWIRENINFFVDPSVPSANKYMTMSDEGVLKLFDGLDEENKKALLSRMRNDWKAEYYAEKGLIDLVEQRDDLARKIAEAKEAMRQSSALRDSHTRMKPKPLELDDRANTWLDDSVNQLFQWQSIPELFDAAMNGTDLSRKQVAAIMNRLKEEGKSLPIVTGASRIDDGMWGSGPWFRSGGEYGRIPIISKLAEIGPYNMLNTLGNASQRTAYIGNMLKQLDELKALGYEGEELFNMAHIRAQEYAESVMYSSGRTAFEEDTKGFFMFLPAYRQAIQYWGKQFAKNPFVFANLRRRFQTDYPEMSIGDYNAMSPFLPFWMRGSMAEAVVPGFVPPLLLPLRFINTLSGWSKVKDENGREFYQYTGETDFDWVYENQFFNPFTGFASKNMSPLSFIDDYLYGIFGEAIYPMEMNGWPQVFASNILIALRKDPMTRRKAAYNLLSAHISKGMKPDMSVIKANLEGSAFWFKWLMETAHIEHPEAFFRGFTGTFSPIKVSYDPDDIGEIVLGPDDNPDTKNLWSLITDDKQAQSIADAEYLYIMAETDEEKQKVLDKYPKYKKIVEFRNMNAFERAKFIDDPKNRGEDTILPYVVTRNDYSATGDLLLGQEYYDAMREGILRKMDVNRWLESVQKLNVNAQWDVIRNGLEKEYKTQQKDALKLLRKAAKEMAKTPAQYSSYLADINRLKNGWVDKTVPTPYTDGKIKPANWMYVWARNNGYINKPQMWNLQAITDAYFDKLVEVGADDTTLPQDVVDALRAQGARIPLTANEKARRPEDAYKYGVESMYSNPRIQRWNLESGLGGMMKVADSMQEILGPEDRELFDLKKSMSWHAIKEQMKKNEEYRQYLVLKYAGQEYWKYVNVPQLVSMGVPVASVPKMEGLLQKLDDLYELKKLKTEGLETASDEYKAVLRWYKKEYNKALAPEWAAPLRGGPAQRLMYTYLAQAGATQKVDSKWAGNVINMMNQKDVNWDKIFDYVPLKHTNGDTESLLTATAWSTVLLTAVNYREKMTKTYNEWGDYYGVTPDSNAGEPYVNKLTRLVEEWKKRLPSFRRGWEKLGGNDMITLFLDPGA